MHNLLIVDDEEFAVEGLKSGIDWSEIGIERLFTAYSPQKAKHIFLTEKVDILLCDIEMPQGTGLELLAWVREHYPQTETIFLTCHADFQYAKQALQLGSLDYLLKPIPYEDLKEAVKKAMLKLDQDQKLSEFSKYGKYWVKHQPLIVERFWLDIMNQSIPDNAEAINRVAEERNIPYTSEMAFVPVLIRIRRWYKEYNLRDEKILEYAIRKSAEEILLHELEHGVPVFLGDGMMVMLISDDSVIANEDPLHAACEQFVSACQSYFHAGTTCYIGEAVQGDRMATMVAALKELDANNVAHDVGVFSLRHVSPIPESKNIPPDMSTWAVLLGEGKKAQLYKLVEGYIKEKIASNELHHDTLNQFVQDFQQMIYYALKVKGIHAHQLFGDGTSMELHALSNRSATDSFNWIRHLVEASTQFIADVEQSQSVVDKAKMYIHEHLADSISREDIANHVFLNPDYLTRVFKKETGMSVYDYLLQQRLNAAAELLIHTNMSVSAIASRIGYANFSYFSRAFKKQMHASPAEYRQKHQRQAKQ